MEQVKIKFVDNNGKELFSVPHKSGYVHVTCSNGEEFLARCCIIDDRTISIGYSHFKADNGVFFCCNQGATFTPEEQPDIDEAVWKCGFHNSVDATYIHVIRTEDSCEYYFYHEMPDGTLRPYKKGSVSTRISIYLLRSLAFIMVAVNCDVFTPVNVEEFKNRINQI